MFKKYRLLSTFFVIPLAFADDSKEVRALKKDMPADVVVMIERIVECNRWLGDDSSNKERAEKINKALEKFGCSVIEQDQNDLLKHYANNYEVKLRLQKAREIF